jgi:superfamily I DNA/RNA helicase
LERQVKRAVEEYGDEGVLVTSFTRAAAAELAMKDLPLERGMVGTLHSHCYRALGCPVISETKITIWNEQWPQFRLSPTASDVDEMDPEFKFQTFGDELYGALQILRAKIIPREEWPAQVRKFATAWEDWKRENRFMDFTDLIEAGLRNFKIAPERPNVIVVDEAQDLTRLQLKLVRQWGRHADHILIAGDDDQSIFTFAGACPEVLLERDGEEFFNHVLSQSYRVPRAIHALSQAWIQQVARREPKEYKPRDEDGEVTLFHRASYREVHAALDDAERRVASG